MTEEPIEPIKVFFSYSRSDESFKDELVKRLSILQRQGVISSLHDRLIEPGSEWEREIDAQLSIADIILLLVSPDFLNSNYCWDVEVKKAMQRHEKGEARVIPVVLRWTNWEGTPFAKFQALPKDAKPIASWNDRDEAFYDVTQGIQVAVENLREAQRQKREEECQAELQRQAEEKARLEAEERKRREEERQATLQRQAEEKARLEAEERKRREDEQNEAEDKTRLEAEQLTDVLTEEVHSPIEKARVFLFGSAFAIILTIIVTLVSINNGQSYAQAQVPKQPTVVPTASSSSQMTAEDFFNRALEKQNKGDNRGAIADYDQAIKLKPDFADAYNNRGLARSDLGDNQAAIADYNQAIKLKSDYSLAYNNRGAVRSDLGDNQAAIADYTKAIEINRNWGDIGLHAAYYNRGNARKALGDNQAAIAAYDQAIKLKPDYANPYYGRGSARFALGDNQAAIADYNQAIKLKPDYANPYYGRGLIRKEQGDKQGAIADFQKARDLYQQQGKTKDYQDALARLKKLQP